MIYISHNLGLILETCDRITVMYSGEAVEVGSVREVFKAMRMPYTRGLFASIPVPGADKNSRPLVAIPGQLPLPHQRPPGCNFGPRCAHFVAGRCDAGPIPMIPVESRDFHASRCIRVDEIDWDAPPKAAMIRPRRRRGRGSQGRRPHQALRHRGPGHLLRRRGPHGKGQRTTHFDARQAETVAIVGESGCGSHLRQGADGPRGRHKGTITLGNLELGYLPVQKRGAETIANLQMIFQNPFDTLNPSHSVGSQIARVIRKFKVETDESKVQARVMDLLDIVKLPRDFAKRGRASSRVVRSSAWASPALCRQSDAGGR
jgi:peptide/nickel transport system ATP-binding protein